MKLFVGDDKGLGEAAGGLGRCGDGERLGANLRMKFDLGSGSSGEDGDF